MLITVAICTWNRARLLEKTLARLAELRTPDRATWELLVIDNNCSDNTAAVVEAFRERLPITRVLEPAQGLSRARNRALTTARGAYVVFTDDDVLVGDRWLDALIEGVRAYPEAAVFGGPIQPWFEVEPDPVVRQAFPLLAQGFCGISDERPEGPLADGLEIFGANMAYAASAIGDLRFDPNLGAGATAGREGEEIDFSSRLRQRGHAVVWLPSMTVRHYVDPSRMTVSYLCQYYEGRGRTTVRREGVPNGAAWRGAPRWLVRQWVGRAAAVVRARLGGDRLEYLRRRREEHYDRGMIKECLAIWRERRPASPA